jgi:hypothetical protein
VDSNCAVQATQQQAVGVGARAAAAGAICCHTVNYSFAVFVCFLPVQATQQQEAGFGAEGVGAGAELLRHTQPKLLLFLFGFTLCRRRSSRQQELAHERWLLAQSAATPPTNLFLPYCAVHELCFAGGAATGSRS